METNQNLNIENMLHVSSSPHIRANDNVQRIMLDVIIALIPASIVGVYYFGLNAAIIIALAVISAVLSEAIFQKARKQPVTIADLSAVVTGLLVALNIPASAPWYLPVFGSIFAIVIAKQLFGGLGHNWVNPALAARAVLLTSWPASMNEFTAPFTDGVSAATPLASGEFPSLMDMLLGKMPGTIGEVCSLALLIGGVYLLARKVIHIRIPGVYLLTTALFLFIFGVEANAILPQLLSGGLLLGAIFMATDYSSSPLTPMGQIIFAVGCGLMTAVIRQFGANPEGVSYAILLMNVATPMIDKFTASKVFGSVKK